MVLCIYRQNSGGFIFKNMTIKFHRSYLEHNDKNKKKDNNFESKNQ